VLKLNMPSRVKHIRFFIARLWVRQVVMSLVKWLQSILAVCRSGMLAFLKHFANQRNHCLTKRGIAAFLPSTKESGRASAAVL
jgi:hypothetical protein